MHKCDSREGNAFLTALTPKDGDDEYSSALHHHHLVREDRRAAHKEIIARSLSNEPKVDYPEILPSGPMGWKSLKPISGSFVWLGQGVETAHRIQDWNLERDLEDMKALQFDVLIVSTGTRNQVCYPSQVLNQKDNPDDLGELLALADQFQFKVFVAPPTLLLEWMLASQQELDEMVELTARLSGELIQAYAHHPSFYGWYLPYELCNTFIRNRTEDRILPAWLGRLAAACRKADGRKPIALAPYFTTILPAEEFESLWDMVLQETGVDILAMQDGVGIYGEQRLKALDHHFSILSRICAHRKVELWADCEVFHQTAGIPLDERPWQAQAGCLDVLTKQIQLLSEHVQRIIIFCFPHYLSPQFTEESKQFYQDYQKFLKELKYNQKNV